MLLFLSTYSWNQSGDPLASAATSSIRTIDVVKRVYTVQYFSRCSSASGRQLSIRMGQRVHGCRGDRDRSSECPSPQHGFQVDGGHVSGGESWPDDQVRVGGLVRAKGHLATSAVAGVCGASDGSCHVDRGSGRCSCIQGMTSCHGMRSSWSLSQRLAVLCNSGSSKAVILSPDLESGGRSLSSIRRSWMDLT